MSKRTVTAIITIDASDSSLSDAFYQSYFKHWAQTHLTSAQAMVSVATSHTVEADEAVIPLVKRKDISVPINEETIHETS